jgi:hypothetical protein
MKLLMENESVTQKVLLFENEHCRMLNYFNMRHSSHVRYPSCFVTDLKIIVHGNSGNNLESHGISKNFLLIIKAEST